MAPSPGHAAGGGGDSDPRRGEGALAALSSQTGDGELLPRPAAPSAGGPAAHSAGGLQPSTPGVGGASASTEGSPMARCESGPASEETTHRIQHLPGRPCALRVVVDLALRGVRA